MKFGNLQADLQKRIKKKFNGYFTHTESIIPDSLVVEQASGFNAAAYTSSLVGSDKTVVDLTAGLGVNSILFTKNSRQVFSVEKDPVRADALLHNINLEGIDNIKIVKSDCIEWLKESHEKFDIAYADPSRRDKTGGRVFRLHDCSPDIIEMMPLLKEKCNRVIVKTSPMLDLSATVSDIPEIRGFHILEQNREVKELLLDLYLTDLREMHQPPFVKFVYLSNSEDSKTLQIEFKEDTGMVKYLNSSKFVNKGGYIYEPSPAVMKVGRFDFISQRYKDIYKLAPNTHLFYSKNLYRDFPGRIFLFENFVTSSDLKKERGSKLNVISRNHPAKAPDIEKRFNLEASDYQFIIACRVGNDKIILRVVKI